MKNIDNILKELQHKSLEQVTRRHFLRNCTTGLGSMALGSMIGSCVGSSRNKAQTTAEQVGNALSSKVSHFVQINFIFIFI